MFKVIINKANEYGSVTNEELDAFEKHNSTYLPNDYKEFLLKYNGGKPEPNIVGSVKTDIHWIYGMHNGPAWASLYYAIDVFSKRIPSWYIPVACDSGGNQFIMSLYTENNGVIALWNHERETMDEDASQYFDNLTFAAKSFSDLLNGLVP